jgi:ATP citrate (pro-S)-lyase
MSAKAIREATGKNLINKFLDGGSEIGVAKARFASVNEETDFGQLLAENPWLETTVSFFFST